MANTCRHADQELGLSPNTAVALQHGTVLRCVKRADDLH